MDIKNTIVEKNISRKILKRYVKDYKLPIKITHSPYFEYFCDLYKNNYDIENSFKNLVDMLNDFNTEEEFLDYCVDIRTDIINYLKNKEEYKTFTSIDMKEFGKPITLLYRNDLYVSKNVGKKFISIDLKRGNFQSFKQIVPSIFDLEGDFKYEDFISKFTKYDYLINSKQFRQTIFGELSSKRQGTVQKVLMNKVKETLESNELLDSSKLIQATNDELVYLIDCDTSIEDLKFVSKVSKLELLIESTIKKEHNIDISVESYELCNVKTSDKVFVKEYIGEDKFKLVNASSIDYAQYFKAYKNIDINDYDLMFYHEHRLCKFLEPIFSEEDMSCDDKTIDTPHECANCKNLESSVYMQMGDETLYNNYCSKNGDVFKVYEEKYCEKFIEKQHL